MSLIHDLDELGNIHALDVNLLVALDALVEARSVTRAAERAGITQSAMSHTLRRLRALFDDPLLVRVGSAMVPTPRAESLAGPVRSALLTLARAVAAPDGFAPQTTQRRFRIASQDLFDLLLVPALYQHLRDAAPGAGLVIAPLNLHRLRGDLETGALDLAIVPVAPWVDVMGGDSALRRRSLFDDSHACFVRVDHPALRRGRLALRAYADADHVVVSPSGSGPGIADPLLAAQGLSRRIALRVPTFGATPSIVAHTDLVLTAPRMLGRITTELPVHCVNAPVDLGTHSIAMLWHERLHADAGHRWLREQLSNVVQRWLGARQRRKRPRTSSA